MKALAINDVLVYVVCVCETLTQTPGRQQVEFPFPEVSDV